MAEHSLSLGWTIVVLQAFGVWSLLVARFGRDGKLLTSARAVFVASLLGLAICSAVTSVRGWSYGVTAGGTLAALLLGMFYDSPTDNEPADELASVQTAPTAR